MKPYEYKDKAGRTLCKAHHLLRCGDCGYVYELEQEVTRLQDELETLQAHNQDLLHEIRVLKNKIATFNQIYDEQLRIDADES